MQLFKPHKRCGHDLLAQWVQDKASACSPQRVSRGSGEAVVEHVKLRGCMRGALYSTLFYALRGGERADAQQTGQKVPA